MAVAAGAGLLARLPATAVGEPVFSVHGAAAPGPSRHDRVIVQRFGPCLRLARTARTLLTRIDPATNRVTQRYGPESGSGAAIVEGDKVWISAHDVPAVWRVPLMQR